MDNPRIHGALRPRVREWILARFPSSRARLDIHSAGHGEREWNPCARLRIDTCMYSIGLRIKEPSSHMAPKRSPYHSLSFSFPFGSPSFAVRCSSLFLSLRLFHSSSLVPLCTPIRHVRFNSLMDLCSLITSANVVPTFHARYIRAGMFIIRALILAR